jgi:hypothetical protein
MKRRDAASKSAQALVIIFFMGYEK